MIVNEEAVKKILEEVKPAKLVAATKYVDVKEIEKLEKISGLSKDNARKQIMSRVEADMSKEIAEYISEETAKAKLPEQNQVME